MNKPPETIHILRDTWGVPHIYAQTEPGALYGQGYAMAEDRLPTMMRAYRKAVGRMAEAFGPDWIDHDHQQRKLKDSWFQRERLEGHVESDQTLTVRWESFSRLKSPLEGALAPTVHLRGRGLQVD